MTSVCVAALILGVIAAFTRPTSWVFTSPGVRSVKEKSNFGFACHAESRNRQCRSCSQSKLTQTL
jgi:hypothetical protein